MLRLYKDSGFTLIELVIVMLIVSILAAIALPAYSNYVIRSRRAAAEACLSNYANYMEVYYATNMSYSGVPALSGIVLDCATTSNTGNYYTYSFVSGSPTQTAYTIQAVPQGTQVNDTQCGILQLSQTGARTATSTTCWPQ